MNPSYSINFLVLVFLGLMGALRAQRIPPNPCPNVFNYNTESGSYYGEAAVPYDGNRNLKFAVNVSMIGYFHNLKLSLKLLTSLDSISAGTTLRYRINFPLNNVVPRVTQIIYNSRIFCSGPRETLTTEGVTNLWASLNHIINSYSINSMIPTGQVGNNINSEPEPNEPVKFFTIPTTPPKVNMNFFTVPTLSPGFFSIVNSNNNNNNGAPDKEKEFTSAPVATPRPQSIPVRSPASWSCGVSNDIQTLVINGEKTAENEYPWLVAMFYRQGVSYQFQCTANLVSDRHAVTAAHCVQYHKAPLIPKEDILLIMGRSNLTNWALSGSILRTPANIVAHPDYRQNTGHCDVAVVTFNEPVTFTLTIRPVCLWDGETSLDRVLRQNGVVAGWGKDENGQRTVAEPRRVTMPLVSQETCLRSNTAFNNLTSEMTFCAGGKDGSGPCTGDSGAGFLLKRSGKWFLRGVVSTAIKEDSDLTCNLNEYIVFADAAKLTIWIKSAMS